jgi:hypothetical protein
MTPTALYTYYRTHLKTQNLEALSKPIPSNQTIQSIQTTQK